MKPVPGLFLFLRFLLCGDVVCGLWLFTRCTFLIAPRIRFVLGCVIPRAGAVARSRNLGQALFGSPVHYTEKCRFMGKEVSEKRLVLYCSAALFRLCRPREFQTVYPKICKAQHTVLKPLPCLSGIQSVD